MEQRNKSYPKDGKFFDRLRFFIIIGFIVWITMFMIDYYFFSKTNEIDANNQYISFLENLSAIDSVGEIRIETQQLSHYVRISPKNAQNYNIILYWTKYFNEDIMNQMEQSFGRNVDHSLFRPIQCYRKYPKCLITSDRDYVREARALIFHWRDFNASDLPKRFRSDQQWILYNLESPFHTPKLPDDHFNGFNLTATYRFDSDVPIPYGKIINRTKPLRNDLKKTINILGKIKPIVWFVSNCVTESRREIYVKNLSKYLPVDIYGKCGDLNCSVRYKDECYRKAAKKYLFYLSFENSICIDYVTEKLFNVLNYDIVPVVFGGANYTKILPPGSYIDASRMDPQSLAIELIKIANNRNLYLKFFEWRKFHFVEFPSLFCEVCEKIQLDRIESSKRIISKWKSYKEINHWYFDNSCNKTSESM
ncbi:Alpha-(1, 3)-fucosyltransferase C [Sarcoptes scabiei]|uniref:Fucosyltransferase n=1 Tax=Sarcoptes scabiei TaxID=52283 RepID=A0A834R3C6_SARSC|nr:Alpha-(1, 3)-fucosyltransferase C [Sarcoptes scabiei]